MANSNSTGAHRCPIPGCNHSYKHGLTGWYRHVASLVTHPQWHPKVEAWDQRVKLFLEEYPQFLGIKRPPSETLVGKLERVAQRKNTPIPPPPTSGEDMSGSLEGSVLAVLVAQVQALTAALTHEREAHASTRLMVEQLLEGFQEGAKRAQSGTMAKVG